MSLLFPAGDAVGPDVGLPSCFPDLNLDRVEDWLRGVRSKDSRGVVRRTFRTLVTDPEVINFRLDVFDDLADAEVGAAVSAFNEQMTVTRRFATGAGKSSDRHVGEGMLLRAIDSYIVAVETLTEALRQYPPRSAGLRRIAEFLAGYRGSEEFAALAADNRDLSARLQEVHYAVRIRGGRVTVTPERYEGDYSVDVLATFERFRQVDAEDHLVKLSDPGIGHIEAIILGFVARENHGLFAELAAHLERRADFLHPVIDRFDQELEFFLAYRQLMDQLTDRGLSFVRPTLTDVDDNDAPRVGIERGIDLALALKTDSVVPNDVAIDPEILFVVVSGPNQGGKTTFARMIGQIWYLAGLGCPVPAAAVRLRPADQILTHFERQEDRERETPGGKLEDDLVRIREILDRATDRTVLLINEMFASTTLADAAFLGRKILDHLEKIGTVAVWVTFVEDLARRETRTLSMVSQTRKDDPTVRTFEVRPQPPTGKIYAEAIAALHGLRGEDILRRIPDPGEDSKPAEHGESGRAAAERS